MLMRLLLSFILMMNCLAATAQEASDDDRDRQYVTDQLRLSLYEQSNSQSPVVKLLQSGDLLLIEELKGPYALVTAPDGTRGWVKRGFLVSSPTANLLLKEERAITSNLRAEIEKLGNSKVIIDQYESDMDDLVAKIEALENEKQAATETISSLQEEVEAKQVEIDRKKDVRPPARTVLLNVLRQYWQIILPTLLVILVLTFFISKQVVEARIKSKFHGIKIW